MKAGNVQKICKMTSFGTSPKYRKGSRQILTDITQQNCSAECEGGSEVVRKPLRFTQELPGWFIRLSFAASCCAAVRADAVLEVSQFMWQPFSTVIHAAVKAKKKKNSGRHSLWNHKGSFGRRTQTDRQWPLSLLVAVSCEPTEWLVSPESRHSLNSH